MRRQGALQFTEWDAFEPPAKRERDNANELFATHCRAFCLPPFQRELQFAMELGRKWRFDFAFRKYMMAVEIEGLSVRRLAGELVVMGRHASIQGIKDDMEKYNAAVLLGWSVLRFEQKSVQPKLAIETTIRVLAARGWRAT